MKTTDGAVVRITTRQDVIRTAITDREGKRKSFDVFRVADAERLERALKAAREKIARKQARKRAKATR